MVFGRKKRKQNLVRPDLMKPKLEPEPIQKFTEVKEIQPQPPIEQKDAPQDIEEIIDSKFEKPVDFKPVPTEITRKEPETKSEITGEQIAQNLNKNINNPMDVKSKTYIDSIMDNNKNVLDKAESDLETLQKTITSSVWAKF